MDRQRPAFVSYARADSAFAQRLAADLKTNGAHVWLDQLDIRPGRQWDREVELALATSNEMLVVLSPIAVESNNVMDEVAYALEEHKIVIPVLLADCRIPFRLRRYQYIDFRSDYQSSLQTLLSVLALDKPATPEAVKEVVDTAPKISEDARAAAAAAAAAVAEELPPPLKAEAPKADARPIPVIESVASAQQELAERAFWSPRIKTMMGRLDGYPDFYRFPDIPSQMLSRAQAICLAPPSEEVSGLVYSHEFLMMTPSFILFTETGMYIQTSLARTRISYAELQHLTILAESDRTLALGRTQVTLHPTVFSMRVLADALNAMIKDLPIP